MMKCLKVLVFLIFVCVVFGDNTSENNEETSEESAREMREFNQEGWRAVENYQPDHSGWIPHDQSQEAPAEDPIPKRRRLRKRKRRPPMVSLTDDTNEELYQERLPQRRRIRPQRLDQIREPWEEMNDEPARRPYVRRRLTPVYQENSEEIITNEEAPMSINPISATLHFGTEDSEKPEVELPPVISGKIGEVTDENSQIINDEPEETSEEALPPQNSKPDLKSLLKQSGSGLSLSEILQQKNLSLAELLMGSEKAISALTEKPTPTTEPSTNSHPATEYDMESTKFKRIPPSVGLRKNINRNYEQNEESIESLSTKETLEAQRRRLALLHGHRENNKIYMEVTKVDVVTEPTTDKRIFVPSHPKYYTSLDFKPDFNLHVESSTQPILETTVRDEEITTNPPAVTPKVAVNQNSFNRISLKPKLKNHLPLTSAKLSKITTKTTMVKEQENYPKFPPKPIKTNDIFDFSSNHNKTQKTPPETEDEPLKMSIDIDDLMQKSTTDNSEAIQIENKLGDEISTTKSPSEKLKHVTAKEEIMEILRDPSSRQKLSKILETRNMTIEELVEQRERGSSQLHLADIFHNKTREPEPIEETFVGRVNSEYFHNFPQFGRQQKSRVLKDEPDSFLAFSNAKPTDLVISDEENVPSTKPKELYTVTSFPTYKIEMDKTVKDKQLPFLWKELYPNLFSEIYEDNNQKADLTTPASVTYSENDIQNLENLEDNFSSVSNEKLNIDLDQKLFEEDDVFINLPTGVKSAIIASLAIVGLSLLVFLTILVIFKWSQKKKTRLNYCSSLTSKFKSPILETDHRRTLKTFMTETLGRKKNYYKSHMQSMSDNIWDDGRKPSY